MRVCTIPSRSVLSDTNESNHFNKCELPQSTHLAFFDKIFKPMKRVITTISSKPEYISSTKWEIVRK